HLTDFQKNYDVARDTYASTWREHGVGCVQCHGDLPANHFDPQRPRLAEARAPATPAARQRAQETCAACHGRAELLTGEVKPGTAHADHFRLALPADAAVFHPDGRMRDEA